MEKNIGNKTFFNYEGYKKLIEASKGDDEIQEMIRDAVETFTGYVKCVDDTENAIRLAYIRYEGNELRNAVMGYDTMRTHNHNAAIAMCSALNRMAKCMDCEPIFLGETSDRYQVADFCLELTTKLFETRHI